MTQTERYASLAKILTGVLALLGGWIAVSPFVLPRVENAPVHVGFGLIIFIIALWYLLRLVREPESKIPSMWYVLVLGILLLAGTLLTYTTSTLFFWSTLITAGLIILVAALSIFWGSRFITGEGEETTIFG